MKFGVDMLELGSLCYGCEVVKMEFLNKYTKGTKRKRCVPR